MDQKKIGAFIAQRRKELNMTQKELADKVNVRRETIVRLEKGKYNPSLKLAADIAKVFNTAIENIFSYEEQKKTDTDNCVENL